ncbi:MAG: hypothetical protein ABIP33_00965 [Pseudolysinimonas sp.]
MLSVAFFRNLNQGQRGSPSRDILLAAFVEAGATELSPYRSNGTVIFDAADPELCAENVATLLASRSPWNDTVFVRGGDWIVEFASELVARPPGLPARTEISFFDESFVVPGLPLAGVRSTIVAGGPGYAVTVNDVPTEGHATPSLEQLDTGPVTSRSLGTLIGLAGRLTN